MAVRMAISLASRSRCPSRSRSCSTCPRSRSISFSASRRNSSAVFFQLLQFVFILDGSGRTQLTDLVVNRYQLLGQAHERLVPFHFLFHLLQFRSRSEEHTSELQSRGHLVCRLLLEKKNKVE